MELKDRIKALRQETGISAPALAERLGKAESTVRTWEIGRAKPDAETLIALAGIFECSTDYLLGLSLYKNQEERSELEGLANGDFVRNMLKSINGIVCAVNDNKKNELLEPLRVMFAILAMYSENIKLANSNYHSLYGDADKMRVVFRAFEVIRHSKISVHDLGRIHINQTQIDGAISHLLEFINLLTLYAFDFDKLSALLGD